MGGIPFEAVQHIRTKAARNRFGDRLIALGVENPFLIAVVAAVTIILAALSHSLLAGDSWMTLVAGREVAENGIPERETLIVLAMGERWIDQQWLAQLAWYGAEQVGGLAAVALLNVLVIAATYGSAMCAARLLGASARASVLVTLACVLVAPWSWQMRAQPLAFPLFIWTLYLAADHVRQPSRRILLVLPMLLLWANIHGSVVLGAGIASLAAVWVGISHRRSRRALAGAASFVLAAALCSLATPYGLDIIDYYQLLLVDPPFGDAIVEWERTTFRGITAIFFVVAALSALLVLWKRKRMTWFEIAVLALLFISAIDAIRGIAWFALAVAVLVPNAVDGLFRRPAVVKYPRANLTVAGISVAATLVALAVVAAKPQSWFEQKWPEPVLAAVRSAGPDARVFPSDRHADWLLWHIPELRGRIAYDIRFELLSEETFEKLLYWTSAYGDDWRSVAEGYDVVVVDDSSGPSPTKALLAESGSRAVYRDDSVAVIRR